LGAAERAESRSHDGKMEIMMRKEKTDEQKMAGAILTRITWGGGENDEKKK